MTREERMVLNYLSHIVMVWGIWLIYGIVVHLQSVVSIGNPTAIIFLGSLFILFAFIALSTGQKYFWGFIILISVPLMFLGLLFVQRAINSPPPVNWSAPVVLLSMGLFSIVYSAQIYGRGPFIQVKDVS